MEVHARRKEKTPLVALVLALIVLGLGSLYLTWRSIAHQRGIVEDHMVMTGNSILRGVDNNLSRIMRSLRMNPQAAPLFPAMAEELFTELAKSEDIVFITLYGDDGKPIVSSEPDGTKPTIELPDSVAETEPGRVWHVMAELEKHAVLISGLKARPGIAQLCEGQSPGTGRGQGMGQGMGHGMRQAEHEGPAIYLVVGLNAEKHLAQFRQYRRAAMYQTSYVFLAAVVLWSLAFAYLKRRGEGRKLVRMERFQNKLLDNMPDGLVTLDESGEIMAANNSAKRLLSPEDDDGIPEILGANWCDFSIGKTEIDAPCIAPYEWEQYDYQGRQLEILILPFQASDEDAAPELGQRLVLIRDRTQIRSLEEDLNEAKRLAAIGSLAAGVAHEVRNPLSALRGFAQLFATKLKGQAPLDQYATTMVQEADRLNRVVTDLLYLAKPRQLDPVDTDLSELGESIKQLMRFDFQNKLTEPVFDFGPEPVYADQDALRQVLLNLISNSLDAISACEGCDKPGHICLTSSRSKDGIWLTVADDGPGMDPEVRGDVFKPFVTGKKTGTGLGLAIVHNIMSAHKGQVIMDSVPDEGMKIRLFFPDKESEDI
ncbi:MAG: ATP-binding protein [Pseudodesulfovibrio sp.]